MANLIKSNTMRVSRSTLVCDTVQEAKRFAFQGEERMKVGLVGLQKIYYYGSRRHSLHIDAGSRCLCRMLLASCRLAFRQWLLSMPRMPVPG